MYSKHLFICFSFLSLFFSFFGERGRARWRMFLGREGGKGGVGGWEKKRGGGGWVDKGTGEGEGGPSGSIDWDAVPPSDLHSPAQHNIP